MQIFKPVDAKSLTVGTPSGNSDPCYALLENKHFELGVHNLVSTGQGHWAYALGHHPATIEMSAVVNRTY